jgi:hypothetical protein
MTPSDRGVTIRFVGASPEFEGATARLEGATAQIEGASPTALGASLIQNPLEANFVGATATGTSTRHDALPHPYPSGSKIQTASPGTSADSRAALR